MPHLDALLQLVAEPGVFLDPRVDGCDVTKDERPVQMEALTTDFELFVAQLPGKLDDFLKNLRASGLATGPMGGVSEEGVAEREPQRSGVAKTAGHRDAFLVHGGSPVRGPRPRALVSEE